jgi:integral membrane sensor domain MASE1
LLGYYRDRLSWLALAVTAVMMCYVGGAVMFWYHAEYLGEGGPAIPWYVHWMLDSTFGFLVLTPALFLMIPAASWAATALSRRLGGNSVHALYAALLGTAFAVLATPGPVAHDLVVGRGTYVAGVVTGWFGDPGALPHPAHHYPLLAKLTQQFGFGLPLYVVLAYLSVILVQTLVTPSVARLTES